MGLSRREFLKGSAAGVVFGALSAAGLTACSTAESTSSETTAAETAAETAAAAAAATETKTDEPDPYTYADTFDWYAQYDVVVLGMGFAGMNAAIAAADEGASVLIAEKMPEDRAGGNSKVCGQMFAYGHGDLEATRKYYTAMAAGRDIPEGIFNTMTEGIAGTWEMIRDKFFDGDDSDFHDLSTPEWGILTKMSPEYPEFEGSDKVALCSTHTGVSDSFFFRTVKTKLENDYADSIDVWYESPAVELIQEPETKTIIGVKVERNGEEKNIRAFSGVCVCTGGFEDDPDMVKNYLNVVNYAPIGGLYNTGDGIKMCQKAGAQLWHMSCYEGGFGLGGCTYNVPDGVNGPNTIAVLTQNATNTGAVILVGEGGDRFINESETPRHGHVYENNLWDNPTYPNKIWWIFDQTQSDLIDEGELFNELYRDTVVSASSIAELGEIIGIDEARLTDTIESFNLFAKNGRDYRHEREAEYMRPFDGVAYYAVPMKSLLLNTQGGPRRNENGEILDLDDNPIPHLYSAGEMGGMTAYMYQGGTNVAECFIMGSIAGRNAARKKDELGTYTLRPAVTSTVSAGGSDAASEADTFEVADNQYIATAPGMDDDITVRVTVDDGAITKVEILKANETPNVGTLATDQMPELFAGAKSAEDIDAVDNISGATVTSKAIKEAVKAAFAQAK